MKPTDVQVQWRELQWHASPSGRILSLPWGSLSTAEEALPDLRAMDPTICAHKLQRGETVWEVTTRLAGDSRILVVFPDVEQLRDFSVTLTATRVAH
jgi:hypothetical protein